MHIKLTSFPIKYLKKWHMRPSVTMGWELKFSQWTICVDTYVYCRVRPKSDGEHDEEFSPRCKTEQVCDIIRNEIKTALCSEYFTICCYVILTVLSLIAM